ncbi:hypothetical protein DFQ28_011665 [Apophysomyces sp. BC1034]|nr:hypothetical protein DFQ30_000127 [Apophysomyces sp. BC1015]KAG0168686.1 hypothetical protein DFQ29_010055 [Apophysomyces sp. BC1021]KAG0184168.1 hypothetical protein DFQ28_011665 [Apophysomyces sp. BC1034]
MNSISTAGQKFFTAYQKDTPTSLKFIDVYLTYILFSGIIQFVYMVMVGTFPYNAFLAGFISTVGSFVLAELSNNGISEPSHSNKCSERRQIQNYIP